MCSSLLSAVQCDVFHPQERARTTKQQAKQELGEHLHLNFAAVCITIEERSVGECRDAADAVLHPLHDLDVDVPFAVIEDPRYEWLGTLCRYHPSSACTTWPELRGIHGVVTGL